MSYKINPNNIIKDPLADLFQQKLKDHEIPVDSGDWNSIKKQLGGNKKLRLWMVFSAVSAAVVALLFIFSPSEEQFPVDHPLQGESTNTIVNDQNDKAIAANTASPQEQSNSASSENSKSFVADEVKIAEHGSRKTYAAYVEDQAATSDEPRQHLLAEDTSKEKITTEQTTEGIVAADVQPEQEVKVAQEYVVAEAESKQPERVKEQPTQWIDFFDFEDELLKKNEKKNWTLTAAYGGSANGKGSENNVEIPALMRSSVGSSYEGAGIVGQAVSDKYGEGKHFPEMSLSFSIGKRIGNRLSVEGGITYTYLYTKYDGVEQFSNLELKQHLHYIGIPVNVTVFAFRGDSRWNLYASGGAMIEKGIRAKYKETVQEVVGEVTTLNWSESISGVQFSLNASIGASYYLSKNFSLFLAPRLSYYFDNDQPKSIRTDKNLTFGINVGLKYNL